MEQKIYVRKGNFSLKDALFILFFGLLIYFGFATILGDTALMGSYGAIFASYNHHYFGYISYIYIFASLLPLYIFYKQSPVTIKKVELSVASFLIFFSLLLAQALLVTNELRGAFGAGFVDFLSPNIGFFGLWIFWFIISLLSMVIIFEKSAHEMVDMLFANLKKVGTIAPKEQSLKKAPAKKSSDVDVAALYAKAQKEKSVTAETPKEQHQESIKQTIEEPIEPQEVKQSEVSEPLKTKEHNILNLVNEIKEQKGAIVVEELEENAKLLATIEKGEVEKPKTSSFHRLNFYKNQMQKRIVWMRVNLTGR